MFPRHSANAITHVPKNVMRMKIGHTCVGLKHKKTDLSIKTWSEINFEFIKFVKNCKLSPFDKNKKIILNNW